MNIGTILQIVLAMLLWAACFPLITLGIEYAPHLTFAAMRAVLAGVVLTSIAVALRRPLPKNPRLWMLLSIVGVGATSLGFLGMFHAAEFVSPGIATVVANTQPLLAAGLAVIVLNERISRQGKLGLSLGFVGILVITAPQLLTNAQANYVLGVAYIILAALGVTVSNVVIKRVAGNIDAMMAMGIQLLIGSVPLAIAAWIVEDPGSIRWSPTFVASLLGLSLFGSALVYWLWFLVLEKAPLNQANAFSFLIPIFGLTIGTMFYGEVLKWTQLVGIALAILGVAMVTRGRQQVELSASSSAGSQPEDPAKRVVPRADKGHK